MSVLKGWGADPEDATFEMEFTNHRTGETKRLTFVTPVGDDAVRVNRLLDAAEAAEGDDRHTFDGAVYRIVIPELADESDEALERFIAITGRRRIEEGLLRAINGRLRSDDPGWGESDQVPFSSSAKQGSTTGS